MPDTLVSHQMRLCMAEQALSSSENEDLYDLIEVIDPSEIYELTTDLKVDGSGSDADLLNGLSDDLSTFSNGNNANTNQNNDAKDEENAEVNQEEANKLDSLIDSLDEELSQKNTDELDLADTENNSQDNNDDLPDFEDDFASKSSILDDLGGLDDLDDINGLDDLADALGVNDDNEDSNDSANIEAVEEDPSLDELTAAIAKKRQEFNSALEDDNLASKEEDSQPINIIPDFDSPEVDKDEDLDDLLSSLDNAAFSNAQDAVNENYAENNSDSLAIEKEEDLLAELAELNEVQEENQAAGDDSTDEILENLANNPEIDIITYDENLEHDVDISEELTLDELERLSIDHTPQLEKVSAEELLTELDTLFESEVDLSTLKQEEKPEVNEEGFSQESLDLIENITNIDDVANDTIDKVDTIDTLDDLDNLDQLSNELDELDEFDEFDKLKKIAKDNNEIDESQEATQPISLGTPVPVFSPKDTDIFDEMLEIKENIESNFNADIDTNPNSESNQELDKDLEQNLDKDLEQSLDDELEQMFGESKENLENNTLDELDDLFAQENEGEAPIDANIEPANKDLDSNFDELFTSEADNIDAQEQDNTELDVDDDFDAMLDAELGDSPKAPTVIHSNGFELGQGALDFDAIDPSTLDPEALDEEFFELQNEFDSPSCDCEDADNSTDYEPLEQSDTFAIKQDFEESAEALPFLEDVQPSHNMYNPYAHIESSNTQAQFNLLFSEFRLLSAELNDLKRKNRQEEQSSTIDIQAYTSILSAEPSYEEIEENLTKLRTQLDQLDTNLVDIRGDFQMLSPEMVSGAEAEERSIVETFIHDMTMQFENNALKIAEFENKLSELENANAQMDTLMTQVRTKVEKNTTKIELLASRLDNIELSLANLDSTIAAAAARIIREEIAALIEEDMQYDSDRQTEIHSNDNFSLEEDFSHSSVQNVESDVNSTSNAELSQALDADFDALIDNDIDSNFDEEMAQSLGANAASIADSIANTSFENISADSDLNIDMGTDVDLTQFNQEHSATIENNDDINEFDEMSNISNMSETSDMGTFDEIENSNEFSILEDNSQNPLDEDLFATELENNNKNSANFDVDMDNNAGSSEEIAFDMDALFENNSEKEMDSLGEAEAGEAETMDFDHEDAEIANAMLAQGEILELENDNASSADFDLDALFDQAPTASAANSDAETSTVPPLSGKDTILQGVLYNLKDIKK